jgi:hypothetical protein
MKSLFVLSTMENWNYFMFYCMDANTSDIGPIKNGYSLISIYFISFILIGSIFLMNLFVAVLFYHFI